MKEDFERFNAELWLELSNVCHKVTEEVIGFESFTKKAQKDNREITELSKEQKEIRLEIEDLKVKDILVMVKHSEKQQDDASMFSAVKQLKKKKFKNPIVNDTEDKNVPTANQIHQIVYDDFKKQLLDKDAPSIKILKDKKPLQQPNSAVGVTLAVYI